MRYRRERPICRRQLLRLMQRYDCTLEELLTKPIYFTNNLKQQSRKMIDEGMFRTALELRWDERRDMINRDVGLIK